MKQARANMDMSGGQVGHSKLFSNNTRDNSTHGHHQMVNTEIRLIMSILKSDCGSDDELHTAKCRLKSKEVEKTTRPFRYDLNQIPHNYTVMVKNRVKGLDLVDRA